MTSPDADLTTLFGAPVTPPSQSVRYRQGSIVTFNPSTFQNTVSVGNATHENLPLLVSAEAPNLSPGVSVAILAIGEETGAKTYAIIGRIRRA